MGIRYILMDIEGTTTPITFVHDVLFPYSAKHLRAYVEAHAKDTAVAECLAETQRTAQSEEGVSIGPDAAIQKLLSWIKQDRKHPALKTLQGLIWRSGYESKAFTSSIYDDVAPALERWKRRGIQLGIYSSGSVEAQKLLFRYTNVGDMTALLSDYFDTAVGGKREPKSYAEIVRRLGRPAAEILFLSDISEELDAARAVGVATGHLLRPGTKPVGRHPEATDFAQVDTLLR